MAVPSQISHEWRSRAKCLPPKTVVDEETGEERPTTEEEKIEHTRHMYDVMFPEQGRSTAPGLKICAKCPVRASCIEYSLHTGEHFGIWGVPDRPRRRARRQRAMIRNSGVPANEYLFDAMREADLQAAKDEAKAKRKAKAEERKAKAEATIVAISEETEDATDRT